MATKSSHVLTDHDEIRRWAEERDAKPAAVRRTEGHDDVGIIRFDFPGYSGGDSLEEIEWDEWFDKFDEKNLALVVQDTTTRGQTSNFNKLVSRDTVERSSGRSRGRSTSSRSTRKGKKTAARSSSGTSTSRKKPTSGSKSTRTSARKRPAGKANTRSRGRSAA